jgi:hypothetical protein
MAGDVDGQSVAMDTDPDSGSSASGEHGGGARKGSLESDQPRFSFSDRHIAAILGVISTAVFAFAARLRYRSGYIAGDEPHYLIFNVALEKYGSLDIMPVYQNRDYWSFYPGVIEPHISPGPDGQPLPLHGFGGPLLWHLPYLVFGKGGAMAFMVAVSVLIVVNIFFFLRELGIVRVYAGLVALLFAIGSPVYIYAPMLFIEPIGALAVLYAMRVLCRPALSNVRLAVASVGLGIIPWVHGRFIVFSVLIGAMLLWRLYRERGLASFRPYLLCLTPLAVLVGGLEIYNLVVWHSLNPAPANANVGNGVFQIPLHEGFLGTMLDRRFGLLPNFPIFALVLPGILLTLRRGLMQLHAVMAIVIVPYLLAICTFSAWWSGYAPPARYIAAVVPLFAYYVAVTLQRLHHWLAATLAALAGLGSYALAVVGDVVPRLRFHPDPEANFLMVEMGRLIRWQFQQYLPNAFVSGQRWSFALWALAVVGFGVVVYMLGRLRPAAHTPDWRVRLLGRQTGSGGD